MAEVIREIGELLFKAVTKQPVSPQSQKEPPESTQAIHPSPVNEDGQVEEETKDKASANDAKDVLPLSQVRALLRLLSLILSVRFLIAASFRLL